MNGREENMKQALPTFVIRVDEEVLEEIKNRMELPDRTSPNKVLRKVFKLKKRGKK